MFNWWNDLNYVRKSAFLIPCMFVLLIVFSTVTIAQNDDYNWSNDFNLSEHGPFFFEGINEVIGLTLMICFIVVLLPIIISIVLAIWIYKDANKRGKEGIIWAIILVLVTLFLSFIGLIIIIIVWLVIRPPIGGEPKSVASDRRCPNCGRPIPLDARICPYCAKKFDQYL